MSCPRLPRGPVPAAPPGRLPSAFRAPAPCVLALCALAACAPEAPPPPSVSGGQASRVAAPRPTGPVTEFDGSYRGGMTLNPDRSLRCRPAPAQQVEMTVLQGRVAFVVDPVTQQTLRGLVRQDGSARLSDIVDRSIATSGLFTDKAFLGEHENGRCTYAVNLRRIQ